MPDNNEIILYTTIDGLTRLECRFDSETLWLSLNQIAELFDRDKSVISKHLKNIFEDAELERDSVVAKHATTAADGKSYQVDFYNLEAIFAVGYRVRSPRGAQFRNWATKILKEYMTQGAALDDERLKNPDSSPLFERILARIRDIRSSEKVFWRKVCDIFATSIDYDGKAETAQDFFKQVQNKMHWAAHGNTAAEVIYKRVDADKPHLGLTNYQGNEPTKQEVETAKNYLNEAELNLLNRIVTAYLEFAELQALQRKPMRMTDWAVKLDDFLKLGGNDLLTHAGEISAQQAKEKAHLEYDRFRKVIDVNVSQVDRDLEAVLKKLPKPPSKGG
ncbi:MAG: virulence RhuM family protein [Opitutales bacterium]|nr:virulence RhuM family protein [Opitutales bacterium]NRA25800.1 virulence RhuM family protein [Opitutales bacterium]